MDTKLLYDSIHKLITKACTELPEDVNRALVNAYETEGNKTIASDTIGIILKNISLSKENKQPICQDTGSIFAQVRYEPDTSASTVAYAIKEAVKDLTLHGMLRQNCVDPLVEKNTGDNTGDHVPQIHFIPHNGPTQIKIMLKGGGSENMGIQYSLPHTELYAGRDLDGVRKCLIDAVYQAQGKGCSPGILGVCIGGDRASGYLIAKEQLFRNIEDINPSSKLARLEKTVLDQANSLNIGPMGLGGKSTLLGVKIAAAGRHPACYYVTVSYSCWATRRYCIELSPEGRIQKWL